MLFLTGGGGYIRDITVLFWCGAFVHDFGLKLWTASLILRGKLLYVKDYADAKFGCVPMAFHFLCHYRARELPGRGTKGLPPKPLIHTPLYSGGKLWVAQLRHLGFFSLRNV